MALESFADLSLCADLTQSAIGQRAAIVGGEDACDLRIAHRAGEVNRRGLRGQISGGR